MQAYYVLEKGAKSITVPYSIPVSSYTTTPMLYYRKGKGNNSNKIEISCMDLLNICAALYRHALEEYIPGVRGYLSIIQGWTMMLLDEYMELGQATV